MARVPAPPGGSQRRAAVRVATVGLVAELWVVRLAGSERIVGDLLNLSAGGALVEVDQMLPRALAVRCRLRLPGEALVSLEATVVRALPAGADRWALGLQFGAAQRRAADRIARWVSREMARQTRAAQDEG